MTAPAPSVGAADRIRKPAAPAGHPPKRIALLALGAMLLAGTAGGGVWFMASESLGETKPRASIVKIGPMAAMPDLRDGVPALVRKASSPQDERQVARALTKSEAAPPASDEAGRKAMEATLASAGLRPAIGSARTARPEPSEAGRPDMPPGFEARTVRSVTGPGATASLTPPPSASKPDPTAVLTPPAPLRPTSVEESRPVSPNTSSEARHDAPAFMPADVPLPPRRPALSSGTIAAAPQPAAAVPARAATAERTPPVRPREAAPRSAQASVETQQPKPRRVADAEEERSVLGVPVPGFIPTGRDIGNAASSISNAVTGLAGF